MKTPGHFHFLKPGQNKLIDTFTKVICKVGNPVEIL